MPAKVINTADREKLQALVDKLLAFGNAVETIAVRLVGKVRTLGALGVCAALWLTYALTQNFNLATSLWLATAALLIAAPAVLLKMSDTLQGIVGLPQRITETATGILGKAKEVRGAYRSARDRKPPKSERPTFRKLWHSAKWILGAKAMGSDAQRLVGQVTNALVVTNPIFAIVLFIACALSALLIAIAVIVVLAYLF